MNKKRADEKALRDRVNANAELKAKYGDAWDQVAKARAALPPYNLERVFFESGLGHVHAVLHARPHAACAGPTKAPSRTASGCRNTPTRAKPRSSGRSASEAPIYPGVEQAKLEAGLAVMQQMARRGPSARQADPRRQDAEGASRGAGRRHEDGRCRRRARRCSPAARRRSRRRRIRSSSWRGSLSRAPASCAPSTTTKCSASSAMPTRRSRRRCSRRRATRRIPTARSRCACRTAR